MNKAWLYNMCTCRHQNQEANVDLTGKVYKTCKDCSLDQGDFKVTEETIKKISMNRLAMDRDWETKPYSL